MRFRGCYIKHDPSSAALADSANSIARARAKNREVKKLASELRFIRNRNHFAESFSRAITERAQYGP